MVTPVRSHRHAWTAALAVVACSSEKASVPVVDDVDVGGLASASCPVGAVEATGSAWVDNWRAWMAGRSGTTPVCYETAGASATSGPAELSGGRVELPEAVRAARVLRLWLDPVDPKCGAALSAADTRAASAGACGQSDGCAAAWCLTYDLNPDASTDARLTGLFVGCTGAASDPDVCGRCVPAAETCDGRDDDCDDKVDEDVDLPATACEVGVGACWRTGVNVCASGRVACSVQAGAPQTEICNDADDDCDGETDESHPQVGSPCDGDDRDVCESGTWACAPGGGVECRGDQARAEVCDAAGVDEDCDGEVNEGVANECGGCQPLATPQGTACAVGDGDCRREGEYQCTEDREATACDAVVADVNPEACNGIDDDCDGDRDDGLWDVCPPGCPAGTGAACRAGGPRPCPAGAPTLVDVACDDPRIDGQRTTAADEPVIAGAFASEDDYLDVYALRGNGECEAITVAFAGGAPRGFSLHLFPCPAGREELPSADCPEADSACLVESNVPPADGTPAPLPCARATYKLVVARCAGAALGPYTLNITAEAPGD